MDVLTTIIQLLRPRTVVLGGLAAAGRWGVRVPAQPGPTFYFVTEGRCWFRAEKGDPVELQAGDYVLSARPSGDRFASAPGVKTILSDATFKARHSVAGELCIGDVERRPVTRILGGLIVCDPANADLLVGLLPPLIPVRGAEEAGARLRTLLAMVREEGKDARPGRDAVLSRLIEIMLIETLRRAASVPQAGVLRGLADRQLATALASIHADVGRGWTIAELAKASGMSRSVFARRFAEAVGAAPVEYLLSWRMALAKDALRQGKGRLEEIAQAVGYQSASAFSTAFRQKVGCPPGDYAARARAAAADAA